ncbi:MAG: molybdopterin cofactor-binding domain-containing protein, partial [Actinomycetota bacterium]
MDQSLHALGPGLGPGHRPAEGDAGAYPNVGTMLPAGTKRMSNGPYAIPAIRFDVAVGLTNTTPSGAYRGAGRPEAAALLERLI